MLELGLALTLHLNMNQEYNEFHPYGRFSYQDYNIGAFYNSEKRMSYFVSSDIDFNNDLSAEVGIASGYYKDILPLIRLKYKTFFIMPSVENKKIGIVIGKEIKF